MVEERDTRFGVIALGIIFIGVFIALFSIAPTINVDLDVDTSSTNPRFCTDDTQCVPAQCCHPTDAVNVDNAPACGGTFCTEECRPGTLDCGQGEIRCIDNTCTAVIYSESRG